MRTKEDIKYEIEALKTELQQLIEEEKKEATIKANKIKTVYDYSIEWINKYLFRCSRKLSEDTIKQRAAWKEKYPDIVAPWFHSEDNHIQSMNYTLSGNLLFYTGGGYLVLKTKRNRKRYESGFTDIPLELTEDEASDLRAGKVPDSLKD